MYEAEKERGWGRRGRQTGRKYSGKKGRVGGGGRKDRTERERERERESCLLYTSDSADER